MGEDQSDDITKEDVETTAMSATIDSELGRNSSDAQTSVDPEEAPARPAPNNEPTNPSTPATNERSKKRKAMEDELKAVELEQKRLRLTQALAEM
jgi:hypothetical protein